MPRIVKGTTEEREQFMTEVFTAFYKDPKNVGRDLSVEKANAAFRKQFGSMLRNKRSYQIRRSVKAQVLGGATPLARKAQRHAQNINEVLHLAQVGGTKAATIIEGTPEQLAWLATVLPQLNAIGLAHAQIDHTTEVYAVVARVP